MKLKKYLLILLFLIFSLKLCIAWEIIYDANYTWEIVTDVATKDEIVYAIGVSEPPSKVFLLQYEKEKSFKVFKLPLVSAWEDVTIFSRVSLLENDAIISVPIASERYSRKEVYTLVARIAKNGKVKWAKIIPEAACPALIVHSNDIYLSCFLRKEWREFEVLLKLSADGALVWAKSTEDFYIVDISKNLFFVGLGNGVLFGKLLEDSTVLFSYRATLKENESSSDCWPFIVESKDKVMVGYNVDILRENYIVGSASYLIFMNKDGSISEIKRIKPKQDVRWFCLLDAEENVIIGDIERKSDVIDGLIIEVNESFKTLKIPNAIFITIENGVIGGSSNKEDFLIASIEDLMEESAEEDIFVQDANISIEKVELKFVKTSMDIEDYDLSLKQIYEKVYEEEKKTIVEKPEIEKPIKKSKTKLNILAILIFILIIFILILMICILKRKPSQISVL